MPQPFKSGKKRGQKADSSRQGQANADNGLRTCAQCAQQVTRNECHKNRYGQYICHACLARLRSAGQLLPTSVEPMDSQIAEPPVKKNADPQKKRHEGAMVPAPRKLRRKSLPSRSDVPERVFEILINVLAVVFLIVAVWLIWSQF